MVNVLDIGPKFDTNEGCRPRVPPRAAAGTTHGIHGNMKPLLTARFATLSRSRSALWKFAIVTLALGTTVGWLLGGRESSSSVSFGERALASAGLALRDEPERFHVPERSAPRLLDALSREIGRASDGDFISVLWTMPHLANYLAPADYERLREIVAAKFGAPAAALAHDFLAAWTGTDSAAISRLGGLAGEPNAPRYSNYVMGRLALQRDDYSAAFARFYREGERPEAAESRYWALRALEQGHDYATLTRLQNEPAYANYFNLDRQLTLAIGERRWGDIFRLVPQVQIAGYRADLWFIAALAGLAWALVLVHLGEVHERRWSTAALCLSGFIAGVLSTTLTLLLIIVQDDIWRFSSGAEIERVFAYYIGGVGLREELAKLILFAPLVLLLRKRSELEALLVACFVGLGFAVEENVGYFHNSAAASSTGRFLTANFLHIALTGLNGLAFFRACTRGGAGLNDFLFVFPLTVLAHGLYDAFLSAPQIDRGDIFATMCFIGISYWFFSRAHHLRTHVRMTLSLTGALVIGLSVLAATMIAFQMVTLGASAGASLIFTELLGSAAMLFVFFREFAEPLGP